MVVARLYAAFLKNMVLSLTFVFPSPSCNIALRLLVLVFGNLGRRRVCVGGRRRQADGADVRGCDGWSGEAEKRGVVAESAGVEARVRQHLGDAPFLCGEGRLTVRADIQLTESRFQRGQSSASEAENKNGTY